MGIELRVARSYLKSYARRRINGYRSPYADPFEYRSVLDFTPIEVEAVLSPLLVAEQLFSNPARTARHALDHYIVHAGTACDPRNWYIALLQGEPVGLVFPQLFEDRTYYDGSIFHIGVMPQFQGRGFGRILHAHGLETLAALGATKYIGSTAPDNIPMQHVFRANGCEIYGVFMIVEYENGSGRCLD